MVELNPATPDLVQLMVTPGNQIFLSRRRQLTNNQTPMNNPKTQATTETAPEKQWGREKSNGVASKYLIYAIHIPIGSASMQCAWQDRCEFTWRVAVAQAVK